MNTPRAINPSRLTLWLVCLTLCTAGSAQDQSAQQSPDSLPPARTEYMGRTIAQTMHWLGAEWLIRETREREEQPTLVMKHLDLKKGMTVADIGCGNGYYTLRLAQGVGDTGTVYAVEIQPEYFPLLKDRAQQAGITNIKPTLGTLIDPRLPDRSCDLIFLADVYHELSHPEHMLAAIRKALKPTGRLVLLEFRGEDPNVPIKPLHKMTKAQINKELTANGFEPAGAFDGLPWQHMMLFSPTPGSNTPRSNTPGSNTPAPGSIPAEDVNAANENPESETAVPLRASNPEK